MRRLSDAEREQAVEAVTQHYAEGRLTLEELERRVERIWRARTRYDAGRSFSDLPTRGPRGMLAERLWRFQRAAFRAHLLLTALANGVLVGIWALTGEGVFWPAWLLLPSAGLLLIHLYAWRSLRRALKRRAW